MYKTDNEMEEMQLKAMINVASPVQKKPQTKTKKKTRLCHFDRLEDQERL